MDLWILGPLKLCYRSYVPIDPDIWIYAIDSRHWAYATASDLLIYIISPSHRIYDEFVVDPDL